VGGRRNRRDVWQLKSDKTEAEHYAAFPAKLASLCVLAGSRPDDLVLDPFAGSGTVGEVCARLSRRWVGVELSAEYANLAGRRTAQIGLAFGRSSEREAKFITGVRTVAKTIGLPTTVKLVMPKIR
jgi:site-specific DNA-methyltransferase (cytosine-N4-specific)